MKVSLSRIGLINSTRSLLMLINIWVVSQKISQSYLSSLHYSVVSFSSDKNLSLTCHTFNLHFVTRTLVFLPLTADEVFKIDIHFRQIDAFHHQISRVFCFYLWGLYNLLGKQLRIVGGLKRVKHQNAWSTSE